MMLPAVLGILAVVMAYRRGAAHEVVPPPLPPTQLQPKLLATGVTAPAVPLAHRFALGAVIDATVLAVPHAPIVLPANVAVMVQSAETLPEL